MTQTPSRGNRYLRPPARVVRRALVPGVMQLESEFPDLGHTLRELLRENAELRERVTALEAHTADLPEVRTEVGELRQGLHEARRLNLRVAEVTDLVTELVLPLHDREIDPAALERLRPDTL